MLREITHRCRLPRCLGRKLLTRGLAWKGKNCVSWGDGGECKGERRTSGGFTGGLLSTDDESAYLRRRSGPEDEGAYLCAGH